MTEPPGNAERRPDQKAPHEAKATDSAPNTIAKQPRIRRGPVPFDDAVAQLRAQLVVARQHGDELVVRAISNRIDDIFVSRNWRHSFDPEIRRLRRGLREVS